MMGNRIILLFAVLCFLTANCAIADGVTYYPKLTLRSVNGFMTNQGTSSGSSLSLGGVNCVFNHYLTSKIAFGIGYNVHFDFSDNSVPLKGPDIGVRWYVFGDGTRVRTESSINDTDSLDKYAFYVGGATIERSYFLGNNAVAASAANATAASPALSATGSFMGLTAVAGFDYRVARHFELNAEGNMGLFTFSATDDRVRITGRMLLVGLSYLF